MATYPELHHSKTVLAQLTHLVSYNLFFQYFYLSNNVNKKFSIPIELTENKTIFFYELKNIHLFNLLKFIQNQNLANIEKYYDTMLIELACEQNDFKKLNFLDKFICLIVLRSICISPDIEFELKKENIITKKIQLYSIIETLKNISFLEKKEFKKDFFINFSLPKKLYYSSIDEILDNCIDSFEINGEVINFHEMDTSEKKDIFNTLPGNILNEAKKYFLKLEEQLSKNILIKKEEAIGVNEIELSLLKNTCIGILNSIFKDNLFNFYNLMYIFTNKMNMSLSEYFNLTPAESSLMLSFYTKEQEEIKKLNEGKNISISK